MRWLSFVACCIVFAMYVMCALNAALCVACCVCIARCVPFVVRRLPCVACCRLIVELRCLLCVVC